MSRREIFEMTYGGERFRVTGSYSPGRPGVHTLRNGDPGWPDEPAELEVEVVEAKVGSPPAWVDVTEVAQAFGVHLDDGDDPFVRAAETALEQLEAEKEEQWRAEQAELEEEDRLP